jgi:predicted small integral membrane protein
MSDSSIDPIVVAPVTRKARKGFLPIQTNTFDRYFISVVLYIGGHLLWMRFVEAFLPLWIATVLLIALGVMIVRKG